MSEVRASHASRLVFPPAVHFIWGVILEVFFVLGCMLQVQTNEAWFLHSDDPSAWIPNFNIFGQFPQFWNGQMDARHTVAFLGAWCIQIIMITAKIGLPRVQSQMMKKYGGGGISPDVAKAAKWRGGLWDVLSTLIIIGNSSIDFLYAYQLGFLQQVIFAGVLFLTSFYAGTHGIQHIAASFSDMSKS